MAVPANRRNNVKTRMVFILFVDRFVDESNNERKGYLSGTEFNIKPHVGKTRFYFNDITFYIFVIGCIWPW